MTPEQRAAKLREWLEEFASEQLRGTVSYPEVDAAIAAVIREAIREEREKCIGDVEGAMSEQGTDSPHQALDWAVQAIRDMAKREGGRS